MKNELLTIGPFTVYGYGLMIAVGIITGILIAEKRAYKKNLDPEHGFWLMLFSLAGGLAGAKVLYWITEIKSIIRDPMIIFQTIGDGFVVYGGIIGGIFVGWCYTKAKKMEFWKYADLLMPSLAIAQGFGRLGCFLAGCCYGRTTTCPIHIVFKDSWYAPNGISLIPTQLYSAGLDFLNFAVLILIGKKTEKDGIVTAYYLMFYSIGRFVLEFFRGDLERGYVGVLSTSQFISVLICLTGICMYFWRKRKDAK